MRVFISLLLFIIVLAYGFGFSRSPIIGILFVISLFCSIILSFRPFWITLAFVFTLAFGDFLNLPITKNGLELSTIILILGFTIWTLRAILNKDPCLVTVPLSKAQHALVLLLLFVMMISLVNSENVGVSIQELKKFTYCVVGYFLVLFTVKNEKELKHILFCLIIAGFIVSLFGIIEAETKSIYVHFNNRSLFGAQIPPAVEETARGGKINGVSGAADIHGINMSMIFLFAFYFFLSAKFRFAKLIFGIIMLTALFNIIGATSRGAILCFLISLITLSIYMKGSRKWLIPAFGSIIIMVFAMVAFMPQLDVKRIYIYAGGQKKTAEFRLESAIIGLSMVPKHPVIGHGPYGYLANYHRYASRVAPEARKTRIRLHNAYLEALVNYGFIGLSVFLTFMFLAIRSLYNLVKNRYIRDERLIIVAFSTLCGYSIFMLSTGWLVNQDFWLLLALVGVISAVYEKKITNDLSQET